MRAELVGPEDDHGDQGYGAEVAGTLTPDDQHPGAERSEHFGKGSGC